MEREDENVLQFHQVFRWLYCNLRRCSLSQRHILCFFQFLYCKEPTTIELMTYGTLYNMKERKKNTTCQIPLLQWELKKGDKVDFTPEVFEIQMNKTNRRELNLLNVLGWSDETSLIWFQKPRHLPSFTRTELFRQATIYPNATSVLLPTSQKFSTTKVVPTIVGLPLPEAQNMGHSGKRRRMKTRQTTSPK